MQSKPQIQFTTTTVPVIVITALVIVIIAPATVTTVPAIAITAPVLAIIVLAIATTAIAIVTIAAVIAIIAPATVTTAVATMTCVDVTQSRCQMKNFSIIVTERCNLRCSYCYVDKDTAPASMNQKTVEGVVHFLLKTQAEEDSAISVELFGGEALLEWDVCKAILDPLSQAGRDRFRLSVYSNMVAVTKEQLTYCRDRDVRINISLDGGQKCHDAQRVFPDGSGSFEAVMQGIARYCEVFRIPQKRIGCKFMLSPGNIRQAADGVRELYDFGLREISTGIVKEPVWNADDITSFQVFYDWEGSFLHDTQKSGDPFWDSHFFTPYADAKEERKTFCSAGCNRFAIAPDGQIYPCQRFYNNRSGMVLGDVWSGIHPNTPLGCYLSCKPQTVYCRNCKYGIYGECNGQCFAAIYEIGSRDLIHPIDCVCQLLKIHHNICFKWLPLLGEDYVMQRIYKRSKFGGDMKDCPHYPEIRPLPAVGSGFWYA